MLDVILLIEELLLDVDSTLMAEEILLDLMLPIKEAAFDVILVEWVVLPVVVLLVVIEILLGKTLPARTVAAKMVTRSIFRIVLDSISTDFAAFVGRNENVSFGSALWTENCQLNS